MKYLVILSFLIVATSCSQNLSISKTQEAWDGYNNPQNLDSKYVTKFDLLPLTGSKLDRLRGWSGHGWPSVNGGIAVRWFESHGASDTGYRPFTEQELKSMSKEDLKRLSPAEKYDIYMGRFDYPTVSHERNRINVTRNESWFGLCNGAAAASLLFDEPKPVELKGVTGITVPFGSADIKALLTLYHGNIVFSEDAKMIGLRCSEKINEGSPRSNNSACRDTNPGAFHIVMANRLGMHGEAFIIDSTADYEVWNHPVVYFNSKVLKRQTPSQYAAHGAVEEVVVRTKIRTTDGGEPEWNRTIGMSAHASSYYTYEYTLELDAKGDIIGGEWISHDRPDFTWIPVDVPFRGQWEGIKDIYDASH